MNATPDQHPGRQIQQLRCRNCQWVLPDPPLNFCAHCGQDTSPKPPTVGEFIQHLGGSYVSMEGALWRSLALLLFRPGQLTLEYLAGRKRRYVQPVRLYLTISLLTLLLLRMISSIQVDDLDVDKKRAEKTGPSEPFVLNAGIAQVRVDEQGHVTCVDLPAWMCKNVARRLDQDPKNMERELREAPSRFLGHWGTAMFLLVPMFALWLKLVYRRGRLAYAEHLVAALHLHAFWFAMLSLAVISGKSWPPLTALAVLAIPVYSQRALKRVYGGRWWSNLLRSFAVITLYGSTMLVALAIVFFWTLVS